MSRRRAPSNAAWPRWLQELIVKMDADLRRRPIHRVGKKRDLPPSQHRDRIVKAAPIKS